MSDKDDHLADELLRRALIDQDASAAVALRVAGLALCEQLTVVFHGRRDLGSARDREEAEVLYAAQAGALRDALLGADTVLGIWREPLEDLAHARVEVDRRIALDVRLPAHRLLPAALVAPERQILVTAVCGARPLAEGRPPMGIVCAQQDVARVYPLPDDPERCLEDFLELAAEHARQVGERLAQQEASGERFLELSGDDLPEAG